jgi:hypothetical protein
MDEDSIECTVKEVLEESWADIKKNMRTVKAETRNIRHMGFRAYYAAIQEEAVVIEEYIMELLGNAAAKKGYDKQQFWWMMIQKYIDQSKGILLLISKLALQKKLQNVFRIKEGRAISTKVLEECLDFKLELVRRYRNHAASKQKDDNLVYSRIIEDCTFDKFGIEDETLHEEASYLLTLDKYKDYVEFMSTINHNLSLGIEMFAWILFLSSFGALYWLLLNLNSSFSYV